MQEVNKIIAHKSAHHIDVSMRKVDEFDNPVNHSVAKRYQRIDTAENQAVYNNLHCFSPIYILNKIILSNKCRQLFYLFYHNFQKIQDA